MQTQTEQWQETADDKALFLRCYQMMTSNVLVAVDNHEFNDPIWVSNLLALFADYYFVALQLSTRPHLSPIGMADGS